MAYNACSINRTHYFWWPENCILNNAKLYSDHEALSETSRYNPKFAQDGLFLIALTQRGDQRYTASPNKMNDYIVWFNKIVCEGFAFMKSIECCDL